MLHHYRRGQACPKMCNLPYMHYRSAFICLPSSPVRSAHLHASAVGLAIFLGWQCPSLELHCHCHASGILRQQSHGLNRFPCLETWAERSLGAAHLLCKLILCLTCAALCAAVLVWAERTSDSPHFTGWVHLSVQPAVLQRHFCPAL